MLHRCLRLQIIGAFRKGNVCLSSIPSTSTSNISEDFGSEDAEKPDPAIFQAPGTSDNERIKHAAAQRSLKAQLRETNDRIRKWREKSTTDEEPENLYAASEAVLSSEEWQKRVEEEEQSYDERALEMVQLLSDMTYDTGKQASTLQKLKPSELDIRAKKKLGKVQFRPTVYNEGELDNSDLSKPPSRENPHPFDPSKSIPPVYSRSLAPYVNHIPYLQALVDLGVNLFEIDCSTNLARHFLRIDPEKDVKPKLQWLISIGLEPADLGDYLTRNPYFLFQKLDDMKARANYLESKKFTSDEIVKIVKEFRYWLNMDVKTMDARLGWIQRQFQLKGAEVRALIIKEPRVLMFGLGPMQRFVSMFNKELQFSPAEVKKMLISDPRLFMMDPKYVFNLYIYVHRVMRLPNDVIARHPFILRCSLSSLRYRHEFLRKLGRARYEGQLPSADENEDLSDEIVPIEDLLHSKDAEFCKRAAKSYLCAFEKFVKSH